MRRRRPHARFRIYPSLARSPSLSLILPISLEVSSPPSTSSFYPLPGRELQHRAPKLRCARVLAYIYTHTYIQLVYISERDIDRERERPRGVSSFASTSARETLTRYARLCILRRVEWQISQDGPGHRFFGNLRRPAHRG